MNNRTSQHPFFLHSCFAGFLLLLSLAGLPAFAASTHYLDAANGNDTTGTGSSAKPYRTFAKALTAVVAGDTVLMNTGNYGTVEAGRTSDGSTAVDLFSDWVTFKAAPGQTPRATSITLGNLWYINSSGSRVQLDIGRSHPKGNVNCYLRFEGLTVDDGINISGSKYVHIKNCVINRVGDLNGSVANIENKPGIDCSYGAYITLEGNEVTHCAVGISVAGSYTVIKDNHIHHNSHDGIHMLGGSDWLIEGNRIHDLDDGVDDSSGLDWNRHVDGIQAYDLNGDGSDAICNVTIRRNLFYHLESMGMMLQDKTDSLADSELVAPGRFSNWTIENNVFGPTGGPVIIVGVDFSGGFVLRHNTVLQAPNDTWTSIYNRTLRGTSYNFQMWANTTIPSRSTIFQKYRVYNNIFGDSSFGDSYNTFAGTYAFVAGNMFFGSGNTLTNGNRWYSTLPYETIPGNIQTWLDAGHVPAQLLVGSAAINAGSTTYASELLDDYSGRTRDTQPDIGASEFTTSTDTTAPTVPTNLTGTAASATQINLTWTASTDNVGVTGYAVYRNNSPAGNTVSTSYADTGLTPRPATRIQFLPTMPPATPAPKPPPSTSPPSPRILRALPPAAPARLPPLRLPPAPAARPRPAHHLLPRARPLLPVLLRARAPTPATLRAEVVAAQCRSGTWR